MKIDDLYLWEFKPLIKEGDEIKCPECESWSEHTDWREGSVGCELCGEHTALVCSNCEEYFDNISYIVFETREKV